MNSDQAQKTVLLVFLVCTATLVYENLKKSGHATPGFKELVALVVVTAIFALGAATVPEAAGPFALLVGLAFVLSHVPSMKGAK